MQKLTLWEEATGASRASFPLLVATARFATSNNDMAVDGV